MDLIINSTKKMSRKPYLCLWLQGYKRQWATKEKATSTTVRFQLLGLEAGQVVEWRASLWDGQNFTNPAVRWGLVTDNDFILISRNLSIHAQVAHSKGDPFVEATGSDYSGDLSGGLTADEEDRLREEAGGDFICFRKRSGELYLPVMEDDNDMYYGTVQGKAWTLPTVRVLGCAAAVAEEAEA